MIVLEMHENITSYIYRGTFVPRETICWGFSGSEQGREAAKLLLFLRMRKSAVGGLLLLLLSFRPFLK